MLPLLLAPGVDRMYVLDSFCGRHLATVPEINALLELYPRHLESGGHFVNSGLFRIVCREHCLDSLSTMAYQKKSVVPERQEAKAPESGNCCAFKFFGKEKQPSKESSAFEETLLADDEDGCCFAEEDVFENSGTVAESPTACGIHEKPAFFTKSDAPEVSNAPWNQRFAHIQDASVFGSRPHATTGRPILAGRRLHRLVSTPEEALTGCRRPDVGMCPPSSQDDMGPLFKPTKLEIEAQQRHERNARRKLERLSRIHELKGLFLDWVNLKWNATQDVLGTTSIEEVGWGCFFSLSLSLSSVEGSVAKHSSLSLKLLCFSLNQFLAVSS